MRERIVEALQIGGSECQSERADVLCNVAGPLRAWDRDDVAALRQHPGERELRRRAMLLFSHFGNGEIEVLLEVPAQEARRIAAVVARIEILGRFDLSRKKAAAERAVGDEAD